MNTTLLTPECIAELVRRIAAVIASADKESYEAWAKARKDVA